MKVCWVGIIGKPNVGKSTLLNNIIQYDLSIVSSMSQTTRDQILGIYNEDGYQIIFLDTPGIHKSESKLGDELNKKAYSTFEESDVILYLNSINQKLDDAEVKIIEEINRNNKTIALITKTDLAKSRDEINNRILELSKYGFSAIIPITINKIETINLVLDEIKKYTYEDEQLYDLDYITDKSELFLSKEMIRSSIIEYLFDEIPHSVAIEINKYDIEGNKRNIEATIYCKKESQKGIIIGANGSMIKKIGTKARKLISNQFDVRVDLRLKVKVSNNWINDEKQIKKLGY